MKKIILSIGMLFCLACSLYAIPASPIPFVYTQSDGSKLTLYNKGDEYLHWVETQNDEVVVKVNNDYEYAMIVDNKIVASGIKVSSLNSSTQKGKLSKRDEIIDLMYQKRKAIIAQLDSLSNTDTIKQQETRSIPLTEGNQKVLCILIGFPDKPFTKTTTDFSNLWNQIGYNYEGSQGSVKDFYLENSYGLLNVTATVVGPYTASHNSSYYDTGSGISSSNVRTLVKEAMQAAKQDVQFSDFDVNENYYVDLVHVVFAGYGQETAGSAGVIWSHHWTLSTPVWQGLYRAKDYICTPELAGSFGTKVAPIGTVCHEYGHDLGAPDYYDSSPTGFKGTGSWDVMCNGSWNGNGNQHGRCPAHHNPYTKAYIYNWVTPMGINSSLSNVEYTIYPSYNLPTIYKINTNTSGEFFLLENKKKLGFNSQIPGYANDGLLIYHIHKDIESGINNQNVNTSHPQKCYIVNANATSEPNSSPSSYGTDDTEWAYPTNNQIFFTASSTPSAVSWGGTPTGVDICFIRKVGNNIKFTVNPQIIGPSILDSVATYSVSNIPSYAQIKWTYVANVQPNFPSILLTQYPPVSFVDGNTSPTVLVKRGRYPNFNPPIHHLSNSNPSLASSRAFEYYVGSIILKATISCAGDTIRLTKGITYPSVSSSLVALHYNHDTVEDMFEESNSERTNEYRLVYKNPVTENTILIDVYKEIGNTPIPLDESYTIELRDNNYGLIKRQTGSSSKISLDVGSLSIGMYHVLLWVDGELKATNKIIKY